MEYSIFQNFPYFDCVPFFLEYSWNIPYSKFFHISIVYRFFGIFLVIFHIPKLFIFSRNKFFMEYSIFIFLNHNLILHGKSNFWIFLGYSIFQNFYIFIVYLFFWNIPGIFHIPKNTYFCCCRLFLEYSTLDIFIFHVIFRGIFHGIFLGIFHGIFHIPNDRCDTGA